MADLTHVRTWSAVVYVAFLADTYSRATVGSSAATIKQVSLVLSALEMALWRRGRAGTPVRPGQLTHHSDAGPQYTSFLLTVHLAGEGIAASVGSVGDAYDNALMESAVGLYKTEMIKPRRPWKTLGGVETAAAEWVDWYNNTRLHGEIGYVPPVEHEAAYYAQNTPESQFRAQIKSL